MRKEEPAGQAIMLTIRCDCGETYHADESHVGRAIECRNCRKILVIGVLPTTISPKPTDMPRQEPSAKPKRRSQRHLWVGGLVVLVVAVVTVLAIVSVDRDANRRPVVSSVPAPEPPPAPVPSTLPIPAIPKLSVPSTQRFATIPKASIPDPLRLAPTPKPPPIRLRTGANIWEPVQTAGRGTLQINNGTGYDAAVTLLDVDTDEVRRFVYIRAHETTRLVGISPCQGRLFFALGLNWDAATEEFLENVNYSVFEELLKFTESRTENGIEWATYSVTLHPVPQGKARTRHLSREEFLKQVRKHRGES